MEGNIRSIFDSFDGEVNGFSGCGEMCTFVRFQGCPLRCRWCDTKYARSTEGGSRKSVREIIESIKFRKVTITGGEPLYQEEFLYCLLKSLLEKGFSVSVETSGYMEADKKFLKSLGELRKRLRWIYDYKLPSSEMNKYIKYENFYFLEEEDVIKFVIDFDNREDWNTVYEIIKGNILNKPKLALGVVYKSKDQYIRDTQRLIEKIKEFEIRDIFSNNNIIINFQMHKLIYPGAKKEV